jgi:hypothetical protein
MLQLNLPLDLFWPGFGLFSTIMLIVNVQEEETNRPETISNFHRMLDLTDDELRARQDVLKVDRESQMSKLRDLAPIGVSSAQSVRKKCYYD